jgi:hypothetical protein
VRLYSDDDLRTMRGLRGALFTTWKEADRPEQGKPKRGSGADVAARDRKRGATRECTIRRGVVLVQGLAADHSNSTNGTSERSLFFSRGRGRETKRRPGDTKMQIEW